MINLRDYQEQLARSIRDAYRLGRNRPLAVAPTGAGKTVLFSYIAKSAAERGNPVMILVHRQELVDQTSRTLRTFGVQHGIIAAGRSGDSTHAVQVASVQTLVRRLGKYRPSLIIVDEAHHGTAGSWRKVLDAYPQARVLGVTATPERLDGRGLGEVFDDLIIGPSVAWLIEHRHLSRPTYYAPPQVAKLTGLHMRGGDFAKDEVAAAMDNRTVTGDAVEHYARICNGAPAVAFCASVRHAEHVVEQFNAAGFRAAVLEGTLDRETRRDRVRALGDGRLHVLASCEIINEGFDLPVVTAAILLRPTASLGLHLQQIGRVLRPAPGKDRAIILDHVGNLARHGFAEDDRDWTLEGRKRKRSGKDEPTITVRQCPQCYCCHPPAPTCPECGHDYPVMGRQIEHVDGDLVEIDPAMARRERLREQSQCQTLQDLIEHGKRKGYRNPAGWARHIWAARLAKRQRPAMLAGAHEL